MTPPTKSRANLPESRVLTNRPARGRNVGLLGSACGLVVGIVVGIFLGRGPGPGPSWGMGRSRATLDNPAFFPRHAGDFPKREEIERSLTQAKKELEGDSSALSPLIVSGLAYYAMGREHAVEALNLLEQARDLGSLDPRLTYYLAALYNMVGLKNYAVKEYGRFLRINPRDRLAALEAAKVYFEMGQFEAAAKLYEDLIESGNAKKPDPVVLENLAIAHYKLESWDQSAALLGRLRALKGDYPKESSYFLAESLRKLSRCQEALPLYEEALEAPLDVSKKISVYEGELACLLQAAPLDEVRIKAAAERLASIDPKNKSAKTALKNYLKFSKKKNK
ncbi:MAG: tetratricopeptide repeat protein [Elusimicrobia bacterium]|nr:tetratricopeptide repeat protein [Elusimicrobiota bacterium]